MPGVKLTKAKGKPEMETSSHAFCYLYCRINRRKLLAPN